METFDGLAARKHSGRLEGDSAITFEDVSFGYGSEIILDEITFSASAGEFLSIIGPSGCGKSTLLTLLDGMARPDSGQILVEGASPRTGDSTRAMVFQNFALMPWMTVLENVLLGLRYRRNDLNKASRKVLALRYLDKVGLKKSSDLYPRQLSGGMQQRVGLARAFAVQPRILLMDEPFGALDAQNAEILREDLRSIVAEEQRTVIFVTHNLDEALQLSNRILLMTAGPGRIREDVSISLPPKNTHEYAAKYEEYRQRLWTHLRQEVELVQAQSEQRHT